ncbi:EamA family transporter [Arthrobacter sp. KBS0703]|jgi:inner membrane transporter RhtA|uniref:EamA family transporter n=1 Tax=Arthrobacter sp. KBS0703 TaxID=1955698 RepID=UPI00098EEFBC|nr:EamA family transporter [Arthrobacter sp. KBS0703]TSE14396.1 EamA family transporter [Arthrobacter sp. KBS0703]
METYAEDSFGPDGRQATQSRSRILGGLLTMTGSGISNQIGAGIGAHAFPALGPAGVVAVRQLVAAAVLLPAARPPLHRLTWKQWWPALLLGGTIALMNICLYVAIQRIGLGLAVTLEFLGPLAIALTRSKSKLDVLCAVSAGVGVYVLVLPGPSSDFPGIGIAVAGAACWAAYIILNGVVGQRLPGLQGPAVATMVSLVFYLPVAAYLLSAGSLTGPALLLSVLAGVLCSVIPYAADLSALRHVRQAFFGVYMSINPLLAALSGMIVLGQILALHEWLGIVLIVATNAAAILLAGPRPSPVVRAASEAPPAGLHL